MLDHPNVVKLFEIYDEPKKVRPVRLTTRDYLQVTTYNLQLTTYNLLTKLIEIYDEHKEAPPLPTTTDH